MYYLLGDLNVMLITNWWLKKVRERLAVSKQAAQKFDWERFNLRKLNELEVRKQYQIEFTNGLAALESLGDGEDINRAWENIKRISKPQLKGVLVCTN